MGSYYLAFFVTCPSLFILPTAVPLLSSILSAFHSIYFIFYTGTESWVNYIPLTNGIFSSLVRAISFFISVYVYAILSLFPTPWLSREFPCISFYFALFCQPSSGIHWGLVLVFYSCKQHCNEYPYSYSNTFVCTWSFFSLVY